MPQRWAVAVKLMNHWCLGVFFGGMMASEQSWQAVAVIGLIGYLVTQLVAYRYPQRKGTNGRKD